MTTNLNTRLSALLDVLQACHDINRPTAARVVGEDLQLSWHIVTRLAMGTYRHQRSSLVETYSQRLVRLETKYAKPLRHLREYRNACRRVA